MRDIILYYYDHSDEMEFLNDIQEKIARKNKTIATIFSGYEYLKEGKDLLKD